MTCRAADLTVSQANSLSLSPMPNPCHDAASAASLKDATISQIAAEADCIFRALTTRFETRECSKPTAEERNRDDKMQSSLYRRLARGCKQPSTSGPCREGALRLVIFVMKRLTTMGSAFSISDRANSRMAAAASSSWMVRGLH